MISQRCFRYLHMYHLYLLNTWCSWQKNPKTLMSVFLHHPIPIHSIRHFHFSPILLSFGIGRDTLHGLIVSTDPRANSSTFWSRLWQNECENDSSFMRNLSKKKYCFCVSLFKGKTLTALPGWDSNRLSVHSWTRPGRSWCDWCGWCWCSISLPKIRFSPHAPHALRLCQTTCVYYNYVIGLIVFFNFSLDQLHF